MSSFPITAEGSAKFQNLFHQVRYKVFGTGKAQGR